MTVAERISDFVVETKAVPEPALHSAGRAVLDLMAAAIAGWGTAGATAARLGASASWGSGPASVWFSDRRLTVPGAAFANAAMACQLDLDDGHRAAAGHPGASIIPAVLATAEAVGASGTDILTAIVLGYEVAIRVSAARDLTQIPTTDSGVWCGPGAAAASGWLRKVPALAIAHAMAISGTTAPSQSATPYTRVMGNHVKEGIPMATAGALTALDLAGHGFTGPIDMFDAEAVYARAALLDKLGSAWHIEGIYFKPWGACRWAHAPVEALLNIMREENLAADDIASIEVETFGRALTLNNEIAPRSIESAQYSIPFCLGTAAVGGIGALLPLREDALQHKKAIELAAKVTLRVDPVFDAMFSRAVPARVTVGARDQRFTNTVMDPKGEPSNPMSDAELESKLRALADRSDSPAQADDVLAAFADLRAGDATSLLRVLRSGLPLATARKVAAQHI